MPVLFVSGVWLTSSDKWICMTQSCSVGNLECSEWRCPLLPTGCVNTERNATECCEVCIDCVDPRGNPPIPAVIGNPPLDAGFVYQPLPTPTRRRKRDAIVYIASKFRVLSWTMINSRYWIVGCNIWIEVSWCWLKLNLFVLGIHGFKCIIRLFYRFKTSSYIIARGNTLEEEGNFRVFKR